MSIQEDYLLNTFNTITEQFKQLTNIYIVRNISTGDRVLDGTICIILNTLLILFGKMIYNFIIYYQKYLIKLIKNKKLETDLPTDIDHDNFNYNDYNIDLIKSYKFQCQSNVLDMNKLNYMSWITKTYKNINLSKDHNKLQYSVGRNKINIYNMCINSMSLNTSNNTSNNLYMPIWKYKRNNNYEYIWIIDEVFYSNDYKELENLFDEIYNSIIKKNDDILNSKLEMYNFDHRTSGSLNEGFLGYVNPNRIFGNLYFDEKNKLINILNKFKTNSLYPKKLCIDNKLGILLYGPPGTGKTGCISAIANYLNRKILFINKLDITNYKETLNKLSKNVNYIKEYIFVFDEIDYILCSNIDDSILNEINHLKLQLLDIDLTEVEKKIINDKINNLKSTNIQQDFIRQIQIFLDGITDMTDRVIIATTNYPERINPTYLRPGRFDLKLKLGCCSEQMFVDIIKCVYSDFTLENITTINISQLLQKNITPLVLINSLLQTNNLNELIHHLNDLPYFDDKIYT